MALCTPSIAGETIKVELVLASRAREDLTRQLICQHEAFHALEAAHFIAEVAILRAGNTLSTQLVLVNVANTLASAVQQKTRGALLTNISCLAELAAD